MGCVSSGGEGVSGSISLSKIAEDEECLPIDQHAYIQPRHFPTYTEVGDEGIDEGDLVPAGCVRRCCDVRLESLFSFGGATRFVFEVTWRSSELAVAVGAANYMETDLFSDK